MSLSPQIMCFVFNNSPIECLVQRQNYPYVEPKACINPLKLKVRISAFVKVFSEEYCDILTLQEVDFGMWERYLKSTLEEAGYDMVYTRRKGGGHGLVVAWNRDRFVYFG